VISFVTSISLAKLKAIIQFLSIMRLDTNNPWLTKPNHSDLIALPTHSIWASIAGPIRLPNAPLLIFFTGGGCCCAIYIKLQEQLSRHVRVLFYDRAGNDRSTLPPPTSPTGQKDRYAQDTANDLTQVLSLTNLGPPYIPMGHSYGGIPARCFFSLHPSSISGMILLDVATELTLALYPRVPPEEFVALAEYVDYEAVSHLKRESGMSDAEWEYALAAQARCEEATRREDTHLSADRLARERQIESQALGDTPLSVLRFEPKRDLSVVYDEAVKRGYGTEEQREKVRIFVDSWGLFHEQLQKIQFGLSRDVEYRYYGDCGHDLPIRRPEVVVDEVRRLLERVGRRGRV
jgi:pimeloyl-ACP methyl ester carboxylesterase